jgi:hypothetical protein
LRLIDIPRVENPTDGICIEVFFSIPVEDIKVVTLQMHHRVE